jgi:type I restriction enzyme, S subunit
MQELLKPKEGWVVKKLGEVCIYINDGTHHTPRYVNEGIPFYSVENVTSDNFKHVKFITKEEHEELIKRCKPERGDILLNLKNTNVKIM